MEENLSRFDAERMFDKLKVCDDLISDVWDIILWAGDDREMKELEIVRVLISDVAQQAIRHAEAYVQDVITIKENEDRRRREELEHTRDNVQCTCNEDNQKDSGDMGEGITGDDGLSNTEECCHCKPAQPAVEVSMGQSPHPE